jgi:hypothetical protein
VGDGLLAYVPQEQQEEIEDARRRRGEIVDQIAVARRDLSEVESFQRLADENLGTLASRAKEARLRVKHARQYDSTDEMDTAQIRRDELEAAKRLQEAKAAYYDDLEELAKQRIELLKRQANLWDARLELEKAEAVSELDRPAAKEVDVGEHRCEVNRLADQVEQARIETLVARERAKLRRTFVEQRAEAVPESLQLEPIEPADSVFKAVPEEVSEASPPTAPVRK